MRSSFKQYHTDVLAEVKAQTQPTFKQYTYGTFTGAYSDIAAKMAVKAKTVPYSKFHTVAKKAADYLVLDATIGAGVPQPQPGHFKTFTGNSGEKQKLKAATQAKWAAVPYEERSAVESYTGPASYGVNAALRSGQPSAKGKLMMAAFKKAAVDLPEGTVLWRGIGVGAETYKSVIGAVIQDGSFQSTSYGEKPAFSSHGTWLKIHVGAGVKGVDATIFSSFGSGESEIIIANNVRYLVMGVEQTSTSPGKRTIVSVLALPHDWPPSGV